MNKKTILSIKLAEKLENPISDALTVEQYKSLLSEKGIITEVIEMINTYFNFAVKQLDCLPDNQYKEIILKLLNYIRDRDK